MDSNNKKRVEDQDFMKMSLMDIKDEADKVISDRKKQTLSIEWLSDEFSITVEIKRNPLSSGDVVDSVKMSEEEKEVVRRLAEGQKQVDVANEMKISQAKVSVIKNKNARILSSIIAGSLIGPTAVIAEAIKNTKK